MSSSDLFRLDGRVAVVTGASSGLGVVFAEGLAEAGAKVVIAARRRQRLEALAKRLEAGGAEVLVQTCDVSEAEDVDRMVAAVLERFGTVDVLVSNAGITEVVPAEEEPLECRIVRSDEKEDTCMVSGGRYIIYKSFDAKNRR